MRARKRKILKKNKKIEPKIAYISLAIILGFALIFLFFRPWPDFTDKLYPPIFEETHSRTPDLNSEIRKIDIAIYASLYQRKISEKNIYFFEVKPKHERGHYWDFTDLYITLAKTDPFVELEKAINLELSRLEETVAYKREHIAKNEIIWHIFSFGFYTHRLRIKYEGIQRTESGTRPEIAIIIDDLGYNRDLAFSFIHSTLPISLSVLPLAPHTKDIANEANRWGRELMLHLPMEPKDYPRLNPGPGTLLTDMDEKEIRRMMRKHLKGIWGVRGINNHMGSRFTERRDKMSIVFDELRKRDLFYVDSRTTGQTIAAALGKEMGVPVVSRSVFLDNDLSTPAIRVQMKRLLSMARHSGKAVGIGHPHKETLSVLQDFLHRFESEIEVVPVSKLVKR
ncbi:MAG: divergent polysaccharide deacetylase family protein [Pseudomonadota bacterium]